MATHFSFYIQEVKEPGMVANACNFQYLEGWDRRFEDNLSYMKAPPKKIAVVRLTFVKKIKNLNSIPSTYVW